MSVEVHKVRDLIERAGLDVIPSVEERLARIEAEGVHGRHDEWLLAGLRVLAESRLQCGVAPDASDAKFSDATDGALES